ncbi:hypothetical protein [Pleionea sp. CnH1-48]|uniref:hypothetical protein n=1 Tax=Pleionea sp. CnH1-48 TaxID=2954494 RepID=UPI002097FE11|nr:hypothetical protein [Pleionea sp. CnH1-48]MCO7225230.1 hypothetical protein [Pleionea sp. CnH1-48]
MKNLMAIIAFAITLNAGASECTEFGSDIATAVENAEAKWQKVKINAEAKNKKIKRTDAKLIRTELLNRELRKKSLSSYLKYVSRDYNGFKGKPVNGSIIGAVYTYECENDIIGDTHIVNLYSSLEQCAQSDGDDAFEKTKNCTSQQLANLE